MISYFRQICSIIFLLASFTSLSYSQTNHTSLSGGVNVYRMNTQLYGSYFAYGYQLDYVKMYSKRFGLQISAGFSSQPVQSYERTIYGSVYRYEDKSSVSTLLLGLRANNPKNNNYFSLLAGAAYKDYSYSDGKIVAANEARRSMGINFAFGANAGYDIPLTSVLYLNPGIYVLYHTVRKELNLGAFIGFKLID